MVKEPDDRSTATELLEVSCFLLSTKTRIFSHLLSFLPTLLCLQHPFIKNARGPGFLQPLVDEVAQAIQDAGGRDIAMGFNETTANSKKTGSYRSSGDDDDDDGDDYGTTVRKKTGKRGDSSDDEEDDEGDDYGTTVRKKPSRGSEDYSTVRKKNEESDDSEEDDESGTMKRSKPGKKQGTTPAFLKQFQNNNNNNSPVNFSLQNVIIILFPQLTFASF